MAAIVPTAPFSDRLLDAIANKRNPSCVGLDPRIDWLPASMRARLATRPTRESVALGLVEFHRRILERLAPIVPAVKPQLAFFEQLGAPGLAAFEDLVSTARGLGLLVIADAKRGDIGPTAEAYARSFFGGPDFQGTRLSSPASDALTINPFFGSDGVLPFLESADRESAGLFILVRTSNPGSRELQLLPFEGKTLSEHIARKVAEWSRTRIHKHNYSSIGVVIGATQREELRSLRQLVPHSIVLLPGYGAQGAKAGDVVDAFDTMGFGGLVVAARSVQFAYRHSDGTESTDWLGSIEAAARRMCAEVTSALREAGKCQAY
jgi:orotidine-5'-phosphate decarboxylase